MTNLGDQELSRRAGDLEWLLCDVDGVLTDGGVYYGRRGQSMMRFSIKDGLALQLARQAGLRVGVLSGRASAALDRRAAELSLDVVISGTADKAVAFDEFLADQRTTARRVAFIGDDLNDLTVLGRCGLSFAPADAVPEVRTVVHRVLEAAGGHGAVREMVEAILHARGDWERVLTPFSFE